MEKYLMNITNRIKYALIALSLTGFSSSTFASGSDAVGSAQTGDRVYYGLGKRVYSKKIVCKSCPMAGTKLNRNSAEKILNDDTVTSLSNKEQKALAVYLTRRFRL